MCIRDRFKEPKPIAATSTAPVATQYSPPPVALSPVRLASADQQPREGDAELHTLLKPVSYTHLDVYKRQLQCVRYGVEQLHINLFGKHAVRGNDLVPLAS